jgi:hypothetical protein
VERAIVHLHLEHFNSISSSIDVSNVASLLRISKVYKITLELRIPTPVLRTNAVIAGRNCVVTNPFNSIDSGLLMFRNLNASHVIDSSGTRTLFRHIRIPMCTPDMYANKIL